MSFIRILIACVLLQLGVAHHALAQTSPLPDPVYTISGSWHLGGEGGWDLLALEASGARLFISRGDRVDVVETVSGRPAGSIPGTAGVHGITFAPALRRGFTSNGRSNSILVFELDTLKVVQTVPVSGRDPDAIVYEPQQNHLVVANDDSNDLSVLDASTLQILATVKLGGPPGLMAVDPSRTVYVNVRTDPAKLLAVDSKSLAVKATWTVPGCAYPAGLALDSAHHRLFSACRNQVMAVTDSVSGKALARIAIGGGSDGAAYDPELGLVFSSNGTDGTLTVIHQESPDDYRVVATLTTQVSARTLALDPLSHKIFLGACRFGPAPPPAPEQREPRPDMVPDSFSILIAQPK